MSWTWQQYSVDNAWDDEVSLDSLLERTTSMRRRPCTHESVCGQASLQRDADSWQLEVQRSREFVQRLRIELERERWNMPIVNGTELDDDDDVIVHSLKAAPRKTVLREQERSRIDAQALDNAAQSHRELHRCRLEARVLRTQLNEAAALAEAK